MSSTSRVPRPQPLLILGLAVLFTLVTLSVGAQPTKVVAEGEWTKKSFSVKGTWQLVERGGQHVVVLDDAFSTKKAPDLKLFLSPRPLADVGNRNATDGSVLIAPLDSHKGAQEYVVPADTDLSQFKTLVIHCEKFSKLWAGSTLPAGR